MTTEEYKKFSAPSEETEQIHLFKWCEWAQSKYPELEALYHIPNEGKRSQAYGARLRAQGLKSGVPDICLPVPKGKYNGLYIELKKIGGKPTENQIYWLGLLERYGNAVAICEGAEQAEQVISAYCERDSDTLDKLILISERGDFDKLMTKRSPKSKRSSINIPYIFAMLSQLVLTAADIAANGTITGRSLIIAVGLSVAGLFTMARGEGK